MRTFVKFFVLFLFFQNVFGQTKSDNRIKVKQQILFICEHGAARSAIASAYFNKIADSLKLNYKSIFRGTVPDSALTKATQLGLTKDNFKINNWKPQLLNNKDLKKSKKIITFDCKTLSIDEFENWDGIPAISIDYVVARDAIVEKVKKLIEMLKEQQDEVNK